MHQNQSLKAPHHLSKPYGNEEKKWNPASFTPIFPPGHKDFRGQHLEDSLPGDWNYIALSWDIMADMPEHAPEHFPAVPWTLYFS